MTVVTRCPFFFTTNPVIPSLSLILSGAGSLQVRVMEVEVRRATARLCGGPLGTGKGEEEEKSLLGCCDCMVSACCGRKDARNEDCRYTMGYYQDRLHLTQQEIHLELPNEAVLPILYAVFIA